MKRTLLTFLIPCILGAELSAQWAILVTPLHGETQWKGVTTNALLSINHDLSPRTAFGLDLQFSIPLADALNSVYGYDYYYGSSYKYQNDNVGYDLKRNSWGITYRSQFFVSDADEHAAFYLGPFVGFRQISYDVKSATIVDYGNGTTYVKPKNAITTVTTIPVGMRFGVRNDLKGFVNDLYMGIGYSAGAETPQALSFLKKNHKLQPLFIQVGYSFGFGWRKRSS